jgi:hypothetical protein
MDHRQTARNLEAWYTDFDENNMTVIPKWDDECQEPIPVHFEVCPTCRGIGKHVNPAIDEHGISPEQFDEDPDFRESYFKGHYDVPCYGCKGRRVVPRPTAIGDKEALMEWEGLEMDFIRACDLEQRYGA